MRAGLCSDVCWGVQAFALSCPKWLNHSKKYAGDILRGQISIRSLLVILIYQNNFIKDRPTFVACYIAFYCSLLLSFIKFIRRELWKMVRRSFLTVYIDMYVPATELGSPQLKFLAPPLYVPTVYISQTEINFRAHVGQHKDAAKSYHLDQTASRQVYYANFLIHQNSWRLMLYFGNEFKCIAGESSLSMDVSNYNLTRGSEIIGKLSRNIIFQIEAYWILGEFQWIEDGLALVLPLLRVLIHSFFYRVGTDSESDRDPINKPHIL